MADTRDDVEIPNGEWVDLYDESGIAVGTACSIYNKGSNACVIAVKATAPATTTVGVPLYVGSVGSYAAISAGESGLWCYCPQGTTRILIQED